jgi:hypothetical protein
MNISEVAETGAAMAGAFASAVFSEASALAFAPRLAGAFLVAFSTTSSTDAGVFSALAFGAFLTSDFLAGAAVSVSTFLGARARVTFFAVVSAGTFESSFFTISGVLQAA